MYTEIEMIFLEEYFDYLRTINRTLPSEYEMMNPSSDTIIEMKNKFFSIVDETATKDATIRFKINKQASNEINDKEHDDASFYDDTSKDRLYNVYLKSFYISFIRAVLIYLVSIKEINKLDETDKTILSYIIETNINEVIANLGEQGEFADIMISYYIKFLISKHNFILSDDFESDIYTKYPIIKNVDTNKGYTTINDKIRNILITMYDDYCDLNSIKEGADDDDIDDGFLMQVDDFLNSNKYDSYIENEGISVTDKSFITEFKQYISRIILADAFIDFMLLKYDCESTDNTFDDFFTKEEIEAIEFIESLAENGYFALPVNIEIRHEIFKHYFLYNREIRLDRSKDVEDLIDGDDAPKLLKLNPICFLE